MCKCLAQEIGCCCVRCVCSMLLSIIFAALIVIVLVGVIVYYTVYHNKGGTEGAANDLKKLVSGSKSDHY